MSFFEEFYQRENPGGITQGYEYQILETATHEKWERRYPEFYPVKNDKFLGSLIKDKTLFYPCPAYFINPLELKSWLHKDVSNIEYQNALVKKLNKLEDHYEVMTNEGTIRADKVVLCTNYLTPLLSKDVTEEFAHYLRHCKPVSGSYLEFNNASKFGFNFETTFNLSIEKYHFIYRKEDDQIQIGASSTNRDTSEIPDSVELKEIYAFIDEYTKFDLPVFSEFSEKSGIRFKGYYRLPFWGKIDDQNLYTVCGLYKNAFTYGFQAAADLRKKLAL